jgi:hypothetical protein
MRLWRPARRRRRSRLFWGFPAGVQRTVLGTHLRHVRHALCRVPNFTPNLPFTVAIDAIAPERVFARSAAFLAIEPLALHFGLVVLSAHEARVPTVAGGQSLFQLRSLSAALPWPAGCLSRLADGVRPIDAPHLLTAFVNDIEVLAADRGLAVIPDDTAQDQGHGDPRFPDQKSPGQGEVSGGLSISTSPRPTKPRAIGADAELCKPDPGLRLRGDYARAMRRTLYRPTCVAASKSERSRPPKQGRFSMRGRATMSGEPWVAMRRREFVTTKLTP